MSILYILATISGVFLAFGSLPQAIKIYKNKSAKDISATTYFITSFGGFIWMLYGLEIKNFPITVSNVIGVILSIIILIEWFHYGRRK